MRERYGDDPSTHPDFDSDLWMEVGSSGRPDKNQVYRLSNTTADNLRAARSVSTVGSVITQFWVIPKKNQFLFQNKNQKIIIKAGNVEKANRGIKLQFWKKFKA